MAGVLSTPFKHAHVLSRTLTRVITPSASLSSSYHHTLSSSQRTLNLCPLSTKPLSRPLTINETARLLNALSTQPAQFAAIIRDFKTRSTTGIGKTSSTGNEGEPKNTLYVRCAVRSEF